MKTTPLLRGLALFLCAQPFLWMSNVALAQALQAPQQRSGFTGTPEASVTVPGPQLQTDPEVVRAERPFLNPNVVPVIPLEEPLDPDAYVCSRGDVFELNFWGVQNFKIRVTIDMEGRAFVSKVGYLTLQGKSLTEARRLLREAVGKYYPRLNFDVTLLELRTFLVHVVEDVKTPGIYPARQIDRVATAIAAAGGVGPNGSRRLIEIRRRNGAVLHADLLLYTLTGDVRYNPRLLDGDVIRVPFEGLSATIGGAVRRPGRYELTATKDLPELLDLAGGLSSTATRLLPVRLVRRGADERQQQTSHPFAPAGGVPPVALQNEDAVTIPAVAELQQSVLLVGALGGAGTGDEATSTRRMPYVVGDSVRTLLERAGGVGPLADLKGGYIIRGAQTIAVDLYTLLVARDVSADRLVELGDTVVVPFKRRNILVSGAVFTPGAFAYNPEYGVDQYVSLAGGRNRFALPMSDVLVISPSGETHGYAPDLKIEPGASVVVPERSFSRAEVVQIVLGVAGVLLSGVALVMATKK
jgi:protein involved in polysaccharide export with SLBB domain